MTELKDIIDPGIRPSWTKRKPLIKSLRSYQPDTLEDNINYNARLDAKNRVNVVQTHGFQGVGRNLQFEAMALALEGNPWLLTLAHSTAYQLFADKLYYFWHHNFQLLYPENQRGLRLFDFQVGSLYMAYAFLLGWEEEAIYQGYLVHAALNRKFYLIISYEEEHRRGQAFMLRLFADWRETYRTTGRRMRMTNPSTTACWNAGVTPIRRCWCRGW